LPILPTPIDPGAPSRNNRGVSDSALPPPLSLPARLAQAQLDAYNAGDIETFLEPYAEDVAIYDFPGQPRLVGKAAMREVYAAKFAEAPELHAHLVGRLVMGSTVIDQELVTGLPDGRTVNAIAIYEVVGELIAKVTFIRE